MKYILIGVCAIIVVVVIVVSIVGISALSQQKINKQSLQQMMQTSQSLIAETILLSQQIQQQKLTTHFRQVYLDDLQKQTTDTRQQLSQPADVSLQSNVNEQKQLLQKLSDSITLLQSSHSDTQTVHMLQLLKINEEKLEQKL